MAVVLLLVVTAAALLLIDLRGSSSVPLCRHRAPPMEGIAEWGIGGNKGREREKEWGVRGGKEYKCQVDLTSNILGEQTACPANLFDRGPPQRSRPALSVYQLGTMGAAR